MRNKISVAEDFYSIQGEGTYMGYPAVFLRLSGCNLMCGGQGTQFDGELHNNATWRCDTIDVWMKGVSQSITDLVMHFHEAGYIAHLLKGAHLVVTGGEPTLQEGALIDFLDTLKKDVPRLFVEVETNGTIVPSEELALEVNHWNISPKLANSGNSFNTQFNHRAVDYFKKQKSVCWKFVIANQDDLEEVLDTYQVSQQKMYLMPACESVEEYEQVAPIVANLAMEYHIKFSSRLQVNIWDKTTGV